MKLPFHFRRSERGWPAALILAVGAVMILAALRHGPPPLLWWLPVGGATGAALWMLLAGRVHGIDLTPEALIVTGAGRVETWPLDDIDHLQIADWTDSTDYVLHLRDGRRVPLFSGCFPRRADLIAAAAAARLDIRVS